MQVERTPIKGLLVVRLDVHEDKRGFFVETYRVSELQKALGMIRPFVQGNHSHSIQNVLRGLHAEPWDKLIYVTHGEVFTAVADLRVDSETFGKAHTFQLGEKNRSCVFIPKGLAHGFCVLSPTADYVYQCTEEYNPRKPKNAVAWNDPDLGIPWPVKDPILSEADKHNPTLRQLFPEKFK